MNLSKYYSQDIKRIDLQEIKSMQNFINEFI